ncbi:MAG: PepSY-associated TM helix domain-containing protein [Methylococcales bacterium]|nr:PepSY-associated TM helix domain-containing protein [Methylococcales bacterium]
MQFQIKHLFTRTAWLKIHLYLALSVGFLFALIGLSGSLSIYRADIDNLLNPELIISKPQGQYQSLDKIFAAVRAAHPNKTGSWTLEMPESPNGMVTAWFEKPSETFFELYAPLMVSVNPYTAEVVSSRFWGSTFTTWILDIHTQLNLDSFGWNTVGILGIFLFISCLTGLILWWPSFSKITEVFKFRPHNGIMLLAFDIHRWLGLLSAFSLILLALTGFLLSYPSILEKFTGSTGMEHGQTGRTITSTAIPNNHPTGLSAATFVAQGPFPKAQLRRVTTPTGDTGVYRINLRQNSEINHRHPYTTVWVDRWSGQIKEVRNPREFSDGQVFATWIWPLHTGEALGPSGRLAWFFSGISLFILYISGLIRWLCKIGKIRDQKVNYAFIYSLITVIKTKGVFWSIKLYDYSELLIKKAAPHIRQMYKETLEKLIQQTKK